MRRMNLNDDIDILEEERAQREYYAQQREQDYYEPRYSNRSRRERNRSVRDYEERNRVHTNYDYDIGRDSYYRRNDRRNSLWGRNRREDRQRDFYQRPRRDFTFKRDHSWGNTGWGRRTDRSGSGQAIFYIILFIALAVLFKWVILKSPGMTAVATLIVIVVFMGHLRDK